MRKLIFIRHGKAVAAGEGQKDIDRILGEVGIEQAISRRDAMYVEGHDDCDLVISSPAPRAKETAKIIGSRTNDEIVIIDSLYPAPDDGGTGSRLDVLFNKIGYKPVADYLKEDDGKVVMEWAERAWGHTNAIIESYGNPDTVAVFGHAVCLQALGMQICSDNDLLNFRSMIADLNLGECEGFVLTIEDGKVVDLENFCG